jgi:hypothetical protein
MKDGFKYDLLSYILISLFTFAAFIKFFELEKFKDQIAQSPFISDHVWLAVFIPAIELATVVLLAFDRFRLIGMGLSFLLMTGFLSYTIAISTFSDFIPCTCSGIIPNLGWTGHAYFNLVFFALSFRGLVESIRRSRDRSEFGKNVNDESSPYKEL